MPSVSKKQHNYWLMVLAGKVPGDKKVAREFINADKTMKTLKEFRVLMSESTDEPAHVKLPKAAMEASDDVDTQETNNNIQDLKDDGASPQVLKHHIKWTHALHTRAAELHRQAKVALLKEKHRLEIEHYNKPAPSNTREMDEEDDRRHHIGGLDAQVMSHHRSESYHRTSADGIAGKYDLGTK